MAAQDIFTFKSKAAVDFKKPKACYLVLLAANWLCQSEPQSLPWCNGNDSIRFTGL